ncbi:hypothetical protein Tco_0109387 [Tanacetum coccineum]
MVKNLENVSGKFLMYPRFVQVFLEKQLEGMSNYKSIYVTPSDTKKIFKNMRRLGKGFSGRETPLFLTMMVQAQEEMGKGLANPTNPHHTPTIIQPSTSQPQKKQKPRKPKRKDTEVVVPGAKKPWGILLLKLGLRIRVKRLEKKGGLRTHGLKRLYEVGLSRRVESSEDEGLGEEEASKQGRIADIDADAGINLVSTHFDVDTDMFGVHDLVGDEVVVEIEVAFKDVNLSVDEVTLAQLAALKTASIRPKVKGLVIHKEEQATTSIISSQQPSQVKIQDKGKGKMVEPEKPMKKRELIRLDEEITSKLQVEFAEEVRLAREKAEKEEGANIVL